MLDESDSAVLIASVTDESAVSVGVTEEVMCGTGADCTKMLT